MKKALIYTALFVGVASLAGCVSAVNTERVPRRYQTEVQMDVPTAEVLATRTIVFDDKSSLTYSLFDQPDLKAENSRFIKRFLNWNRMDVSIPPKQDYFPVGSRVFP